MVPVYLKGTFSLGNWLYKTEKFYLNLKFYIKQEMIILATKQ